MNFKKIFTKSLFLFFFVSVLYLSYSTVFSEENRTIPNFTEEEKEYIKNSKPLKVGMLSNRRPLSYLDKNTGKMIGISCEIMNEISKISGLKFDIQSVPEDKTPIECLKLGMYDIASGVVNSEIFRNDKEIMLTDSFLKSRFVIVVKNGTKYSREKIYTASVPRSFQFLREYLHRDYPHWNIVLRSKEDSLDSVVSGEADLTILNEHEIGYMIQMPKYSNLTVVSSYFYKDASSMALKSNDNPVLLNIINKSISCLNKEKIQEVLINNTVADPYRYSLGDIFYQYKYSCIIILLLLVLVIILLLLISLNKNKNLSIIQSKNEQLLYIAAEAKKANEAKSKFFSQMSHEIRTPLNVILSFVEISQKEIDDKELLKDYLQKISNSSKVLLGIINEVLDMSAIENNKLKLSNSSFGIKHLLSSTGSFFYQDSKEKGINFNIKTNGIREDIVIGDELRLNQILNNLISNALKFTPKGGQILIDVTQTSDSVDKVYFRFVVSDTGCGISEDFQQRVFLPFEQESEKITKEHGGSGLGLAITKKLVELMGGQISVKSEINKGTSFTVDLPFTKVEEDKKTVLYDFSAIRVLVVDDDMGACEYASLILERLGVRNEYVMTGEDALKTLSLAKNNNEPFKMCIVDWRMPNINGIELLQKIKSNFGKEIVTVITSAYDLNELSSKYNSKGVDYFIPKPLFQSSVYNLIVKIFSQNKSSKSLEYINSEFYDFKGYKALIAEDIPLNMEVIVKILQYTGIDIDCAEDGKQALQMFSSSKENYYDVILIDIDMPIMNGYDATKNIRALNRSDAQKVPIFAMTANAFTSDIAEAINSGMNGHILKPIEIKILYEILNKVLKECEKKD